MGSVQPSPACAYHDRIPPLSDPVPDPNERPMSQSPAVLPGASLRTQFMERNGLSASGLAIRLHVPAPNAAA